MSFRETMRNFHDKNTNRCLQHCATHHAGVGQAIQKDSIGERVSIKIGSMVHKQDIL